MIYSKQEIITTYSRVIRSIWERWTLAPSVFVAHHRRCEGLAWISTWEHRASTNSHHLTLFTAKALSFPHLFPKALASSTTDIFYMVNPISAKRLVDLARLPSFDHYFQLYKFRQSPKLFITGGVCPTYLYYTPWCAAQFSEICLRIYRCCWAYIFWILMYVPAQPHFVNLVSISDMLRDRHISSTKSFSSLSIRIHFF